MLPYEIDPYAQSHINALDSVKELLLVSAGKTISIQEIRNAFETLERAQTGFERFKACMADEVAQKNRYRDRFLATKK